MTEKDMFLESLARESATTVKVLKAFPAGKEDLKPAPIMKTARELAFDFVSEQSMADMAVNGVMDFSIFPKVSGTIPEIIARLEKRSAETWAKVKAMPESDYNAVMDFVVGPKKMAKVRRADILWLTLQDMIHHRGQFSVYVRMAGGIVPSIYGPTLEEPWG